VFDEFRYGAGAGRGTRKQGWTATQPTGISERSSDDRVVEPAAGGRVVVLGGNRSTLAIANSLSPSAASVTAHLIPLASTPLGIAVGDTRQELSIPLSGLFEWIDRTFSAEDEHAFVAPLRDLELLVRVGWQAPFPERVDDRSVLNIEDLPEDIADALARPQASLVQCGVCRRLCVADQFAWKEKQLCAWDYHAQAFGRRGPWHEGAYAERHFETLPSCAYVVHPLLAELNVDVVLMVSGVDEPLARDVVNRLLEGDQQRPHMVVMSEGGFTVLREA
jgi:hypothetical protein